MNADTLSALIDEVAAGERLVGAACLRAGMTEIEASRAEDATLRNSVDSVRSLQRALLPGWCVDVSETVEGWTATVKEPVLSEADGSFAGRRFSGSSAEGEAAARLLSVLRALLAEAED